MAHIPTRINAIPATRAINRSSNQLLRATPASTASPDASMSARDEPMYTLNLLFCAIDAYISVTNWDLSAISAIKMVTNTVAANFRSKAYLAQLCTAQQRQVKRPGAR